MIVVEGVETVDCEGLNTVIPGKTKLPLSHQVHIMVAIIIIIIVIFIVIIVVVLQHYYLHINIIVIIAPALQSISLSGNKCVGNEAFASLIKCDYMLEFHLLSVILD